MVAYPHRRSQRRVGGSLENLSPANYVKAEVATAFIDVLPDRNAIFSQAQHISFFERSSNWRTPIGGKDRDFDILLALPGPQSVFGSEVSLAWTISMRTSFLLLPVCKRCRIEAIIIPREGAQHPRHFRINCHCHSPLQRGEAHACVLSTFLAHALVIIKTPSRL